MCNHKEKKEKIVQLLNEYFKKKFSIYHIKMVFLYGSWAKGYPHEDSDIDLAIQFSVPAEKEDTLFELINGISYELSLQIGKEVNIIPIKEDFPHPMLYYNAIIQGMPVYIKSAQSLIDLKLEALRQMEDFKIFGTTWQQEVVKKILKEITHA